MLLYVVSPAAKNDLIDIYAYTDNAWGNEQAEIYLSEIDQTLTLLAENPKMGYQRNDIQNGFMSFPQSKHIVFYRIIGNDIEVIRILHSSMDVKKQFNLGKSQIDQVRRKTAP